VVNTHPEYQNKKLPSDSCRGAQINRLQMVQINGERRGMMLTLTEAADDYCRVGNRGGGFQPPCRS
jgi:hypothetical protein